AGDTARAVVAYRRGLRHDPASRGLQEGLAAAREGGARKGISRGRPPSDDRPPWLPRVGFAPWSFVLCLAAYTTGWLMLARWLMVRRGGLLGGGVTVLLLACAATVLLGLATLYEQRANEQTLVVIARDE